jgi:hypothetical protein
MAWRIWGIPASSIQLCNASMQREIWYTPTQIFNPKTIFLAVQIQWIVSWKTCLWTSVRSQTLTTLSRFLQVSAQEIADSKVSNSKMLTIYWSIFWKCFSRKMTKSIRGVKMKNLEAWKEVLSKTSLVATISTQVRYIFPVDPLCHQSIFSSVLRLHESVEDKRSYPGRQRDDQL